MALEDFESGPQPGDDFAPGPWFGHKVFELIREVLMQFFWVVLNGILALVFLALPVFIGIWLVKLNKRVAKIETLISELKKDGKYSP